MYSDDDDEEYDVGVGAGVQDGSERDTLMVEEMEGGAKA